MKNYLIGMSFLAVTIATVGESAADCSAYTTTVDPTTVLTPAVMIQASDPGGESWNEVQCAGGQLWDQKQGASSTVDPSDFVGSWSMTNAVVTYDYGSGGAYTYELKSNGTNYCLDGAKDFEITLTSLPTNACSAAP